MYNASDMQLVSEINGQKLFIYKSDDGKGEIEVDGYFNDAVDDYLIATDDIIVTCERGFENGRVSLLVVTNGEGCVTVQSQN